MSEPISGAAAGAAGLKLLSGTAVGAFLAAVVVMCATTPRNPKEWAIGLISTVISSIGGGCAVIEHFQLHSWIGTTTGLVALLGLVFACGLPGWALVRWTFNFIIKNQGKDIAEVAADVKGVL